MCDGLPNTRDRTLTGFSTNHGAPDRRPMVRHCSATATAFAWNIGSAARLAANQRAPLTAMSVQGGKPNTAATSPDRMSRLSSGMASSMVAGDLAHLPVIAGAGHMLRVYQDGAVAGLDPRRDHVAGEVAQADDDAHRALHAARTTATVSRPTYQSSPASSAARTSSPSTSRRSEER